MKRPKNKHKLSVININTQDRENINLDHSLAPTSLRLTRVYSQAFYFSIGIQIIKRKILFHRKKAHPKHCLALGFVTVTRHHLGIWGCLQVCFRNAPPVALESYQNKYVKKGCVCVGWLLAVPIWSDSHCAKTFEFDSQFVSCWLKTRQVDVFSTCLARSLPCRSRKTRPRCSASSGTTTCRT